MTDVDVWVVDDDDLPPDKDWALMDRENGQVVAFVKAVALARHPERTMREVEVAADAAAATDHPRRRKRTAANLLRLLHLHHSSTSA